MLNYAWNEEEAREALIEYGTEQGIQQGENRLARLVARLIQDGKEREMQEALASETARNRLYALYGIS